MELKGTIIFTNPHSSVEGDYVSIEVTDDLSGTRAVDVKMSYEAFGKAIACPTHVPCTFEPSSDKVGMQVETKRVTVPTGSHRCPKGKEAAQFLASFEIDGWTGRISDMSNHHRHSRGGKENFQSVVFTRWVDRPSPKPA